MSEPTVDLREQGVVCAPVDSSLCGDQGTIVTAVAYLDAHYQLDPDACNQQVVLPWVWTARFTAELTYQSATKALCLAQGESYGVQPSHDLESKHSYWCERVGSGKSARVELTNRCKAIKELWRPIEQVDTNGLMFRYPLGYPDRQVPPLPEAFAEHCDWPLRLRKVIALVCDITIERLPDESEACRNALRHLRCAAAAKACLAGYNPSSVIDDNHDFGLLLGRDPDHFDVEVDWHQVIDDGIWERNAPIPPELVDELMSAQAATAETPL